jgi:hypothetical protein
MKTESKTAATKRDGADIAFGVLPSLIRYQLRQVRIASCHLAMVYAIVRQLNEHSFSYDGTGDDMRLYC